MGFSLNQYGKPVYDDAAEPLTDLQAAADYAFRMGNVLVGFESEKDALLNSQISEGWLFSSVISGRIWLRAGGVWELVYEKPSGWQDVTVFGSGFNPYSGSGWSGVKWQTINGVGMVNGAAINTGTWVAGAAICNVPGFCRPQFKTQGIGGVEMLPNGDIIATGGGGPGAVSFAVPNIV